jgi:hypothetical protein
MPGDEVRWVVRHALRGLVKQGHAGALGVLGVGRSRVELKRFRVAPGRLRFGQPLTLTLEISGGVRQSLIIDYKVHHQKKDGSLAPKVFKWVTCEVEAGETLRLEKRHAIRAISTRRYYGGRHAVEVMVNGQSLAEGAFELVGVPQAGA